MTAPVSRKGSLWATVKAVAWSFLGVRRSSGLQEDIGRLSPYHVIGVGVAGGVLFVLFLIGLVNWAVAA
ncbi:MAG: DUF2970 domain-containing protein [Curvibacter sp.]|jgi:hypothetical protein|nr:DUF2970 domain-containing protein [Curvibacter sp.]